MWCCKLACKYTYLCWFCPEGGFDPSIMLSYDKNVSNMWKDADVSIITKKYTNFHKNDEKNREKRFSTLTRYVMI